MTNSVDPGKDKIHVLLVAHNPIFVFITTRVMQEHDEVTVIGSVTRQEAVQATSLRPDVILLDMDVSDPSGIETISLLRGALPQVGIVALSMLNAASYRQAALEAGAAAFVAKSAIDTDLLPAISRAARVTRNGKPPAPSHQEKEP